MDCNQNVMKSQAHGENPMAYGYLTFDQYANPLSDFDVMKLTSTGLTLFYGERCIQTWWFYVV